MKLLYENRFDVEYITITDDEGYVILRSYNDKKGDSIINQVNISEALKEILQQPSLKEPF